MIGPASRRVLDGMFRVLHLGFVLRLVWERFGIPEAPNTHLDSQEYSRIHPFVVQNENLGNHVKISLASQLFILV